VADEDKLAIILSEFARTLVTDFPIQGILDRLVERIVDVLPITGAGVTLISAGRAPRYVAASNDKALRFEELQSEVGEGPCLAAYERGEAVIIDDLAQDDRFPIFASRAVAAGLAAIFTFPLRHGEDRLGALDLYRETTGGLTVHDLATAQTLADVAAAYLTNAESRDEARAASESFHHASLHDPLTGLPNRLLLMQRLEHAGRRMKRSQKRAAILFADLDRFKQVNDLYGHQVGDELLTAVAQRLMQLVRPGDTLARVSGDEFVFLCEDLDDEAGLDVVARRIDKAFGRPFVIHGIDIIITASVGIAMAGPGDELSDKLVIQADTAMYRAKRDGGARHHLIDLRDVAEAEARSGLEGDLREALAHDQLDVAYQPIVQCTDGRLTGVEALLRWNHPVRGAINPVSMIEIAEQSTLINDIGIWILERSCRAHARWRQDHPHMDVDLSVNVSARQLMSPDFVEAVSDVLARTGTNPSRLILEMTENIFMEDTPKASAVLARLTAMGIRLALDDFGTGYSSLGYLRRMPVHIVKLDRSFISDIGRVPTGSSVAGAVTRLAHVLGLTVIAEGVETEAEANELITMRCDYAQGYHYASPMSASAISVYLGDAVPGVIVLPSQPTLTSVAL
jgi:diguanylate cyclase (GGDEF)-like protein